MTDSAPMPDFGPAVATLLTEIVDGPPGREAYMLNPGDPGLLRSLDRVAWIGAARPSADDGAPIAQHVDHVRYGLSLLNRWADGEENPFATADWAAAWKTNVGSEEDWDRLRAALRDEAHRWIARVRDPADLPPLDHVALRGIIGSAAHLGYHLGAIRQIDSATRGPKQAE